MPRAKRPTQNDSDSDEEVDVTQQSKSKSKKRAASEDEEEEEGEETSDEDAPRRKSGRKSTQVKKVKEKGKGKRKSRTGETDSDEEEEGGGRKKGKERKSKAGGEKVELNDEGKLDKAKEIARLAVFTELHRRPLKREDISKRALGHYTRHFNSTLPPAQHLLKKVLGFELIDLSEVTKSTQADSDFEDEGKTADGKQKKSITSKGYILRSCLDQKLIAKAAEPFEVKIDGENAELRVLEFDEDENGGSGLDGIRMLVLAIILAKNRRVSHEDLLGHMKSLGISPATPLPLNPLTPGSFPTTLPSYLALLKTQSYISIHKVDVPPDSPLSGKEYTWGPRAFVEIGEKSVAEFMMEIEKEGNEKVQELEGEELNKWEEEWLDDLSRVAGYKDVKGLKSAKGYKGVSAKE